MLEITIFQPNKPPLNGKLVQGLYIVGAGDKCHIQLFGSEIGFEQFEFVYKQQLLTITDLNSGYKTFLDGYELEPQTRYEVAIGAKITVGDVVIIIVGTAEPEDEMPIKLSDTQTIKKEQKKITEAVKELSEFEACDETPILRISGVPENARELIQKIKKEAHLELLKRLNLKKMALSGATDKELADKAAQIIHEIIAELKIELPENVTREIIEKELVAEAIGLGPLESLIAIDDISEIMVNGPNDVYVEYKGKLYKTDTAFAGSHQALAAIERIVSPLGRRIDESSPMVDARLPDGSRVNAIIPPLSLIGPSITIRKFSKDPLTVENLIDFGSVTADIFRFLKTCVLLRKNIIISGGTGSGKTTFLNIMSDFLPSSERIITIEDAAELQLRQDHVIRLESRPPNLEGKGEVTIRDLLRNSLRMRPDRIVVGECRGGEALDMLQAMNTGHDGSLTTIHANSPRDALARLETLVLMSGFDLPLRAIREQIASAVAIIIQVSRQKDGSRKLTNVSEVIKMEGEVITMQDIFNFKHQGWDSTGKIVGRHEATGLLPTFMDELERSQINLDINMFNPER